VLGRHQETLVVPLLEEESTRRALDVAYRLASDHDSRLVLIAPLFVELELPIDAHFEEAEAALRAELRREQAVTEGRGIHSEGRIVRARHGELGVGVATAAREANASLVVVGAAIAPRRGFRRPFSRDVWSVLQDAPCPVLLATAATDQPWRAAA
jgi:nucleotide-binding universal stress UspA family protein